MNLTKRQRIILWIGGILIILRLLFPYQYKTGIRMNSRTDVGKTIFHCVAIGVVIGLLLMGSKKGN